MGLNPLRTLGKLAPNGNGGHHLAFGKSIGTVIALLVKQ
jgi:hypothetical protein